jgi:sulfur relay (sulfurtransferase) complex TusBCD TusD component (DsrE family)
MANLGFTCSYLGKGFLNAHIISERVPRPQQVDNSDWAIGLGMHNFRALERKFSKLKKNKQRKISKSKKAMKKRTSSRRYRSSKVGAVSLFREQGFNPKFSNTKEPYSVNKACKAIADVNDKMNTFSGLCDFLRQRRLWQTGRYRRYLASMRANVATLRSEKIMAKLEKHSKSIRDVRRRKWFHDMSFGKLPTMLVKLLKNGFSKYCFLVSRVGSGFAFWLMRHWKTKELFHIRLKLEKEANEKEKRERARVGADFFGGVSTKGASKPSRSDYPNFKKWKEAVERWQVQVVSCTVCYKGIYEKEYDADKCMWRKNYIYSRLNYKPCHLCGETR